MIRASAGPSTRRPVMAAPTALPMLTAPAAARPALPGRRARSRGGLRGAHDARAARERDLGRAAEIVEVHVLHLAREVLVLHRDVQLPVADPRLEIEIRRAHPCPSPIRDRGLGVEHRAVPFVDAHAALEERAVPRPREAAQDPDVARAGHQHAHIHAVARRRAERLHVRGRADEVGIGEPEGVPGRGRDELVQAIELRGPGHARDHAHRHVPRRRQRLPRRPLPVGDRSAGQRPHPGERRFQIGDRRPADRDAGVAPGLDAAGRIADPGAPHAEPGDEGDAPVHRQHLPVVAGDPGERARQAGRIEAADLDTALAQLAPESPGGLAHRAEPVVDDADPHALARPWPSSARANCCPISSSWMM